MLTPGINWPGTELRLTTVYHDSTEADVDPTTVTLQIMDPYGTISSYLYGTDPEIGKTSTGNYYCDYTPEVGGRYFGRWKATGTGTTLNEEFNFTVQASPFVDDIGPRAYDR